MTDAKQIARRIFQETLASIDIPLAMERRVLCSGSGGSPQDSAGPQLLLAEVQPLMRSKPDSHYS